MRVRSGGQSRDKAIVVIVDFYSFHTHAGATPRKHGECASFSEVRKGRSLVGAFSMSKE